ncbi:extracellular solute-binding protein family 1 [Oleidesulfovibrio alaskensis G20]|jgi:spermidine/putrescine transport system substrate-binding protein|uniref:Extracellular solute-binding protein family 1 n=1 Tax=Oleidesulfovibrio alaskensis (strain ATCC BAA-1058 / DSM 17464 / G20) TaxID=207559 RepID=Q30V30_OLEA2|nr:spermidine/putrescine ABC transporter substrate-binding protein [Oleidesulfovibrio alaskensis]ABB40466.1 extracellular solute-binding protein family 1 [Oleidesulfovibrio alaskensis G20]MBG0772720.1 spermidine/putrescine ABC transporter substrate-binding protein [Oleidesulfovibrio alaskensis]MBL3581931.1 spermidine/putrescine ABC transporter substrate-binding protein [Oleidesulfovibrio alaskensis]
MKKLFAVILTVMLCPFFAQNALAQDEKILNVYNWSEYIPQDVLTQFTEETGIEINYTTFESNEAMYAKLKLLDGKGYDVVVPSTYFVTLMREQGLLARIDTGKLDNFKHIDPFVLHQPFDPKNEYSVPYMWGSTSLLVNTDHVDPASVTSWHDLLRPEFKGKIILSDDLRDTMGMALLATGHSVNSRSDAELKEAYEFLKQLYPSVRVFDVTATKQAFASEEVIIGMSWNGDATVLTQEMPNLQYIYPREGAPLWLDSLCIPKNAEHKDNAHTFINFLLRPDIAKRIVEEYLYSTPNKAAWELLPEDLKNSRAVSPTAQDLEKSEFCDSVGPALQIYEKYWQMLKTRS